jgi:hypothetical protein
MAWAPTEKSESFEVALELQLIETKQDTTISTTWVYMTLIAGRMCTYEKIISPWVASATPSEAHS